jgi:micrococcal nuclease
MRFFIILLWTVLLAVPAFAAQTLEGKVIKISDGDTITILTDEKRQVKVRLYGVDCPESKQAYGTRARQSTSGHVFGKRVRVEVADTDRYGRTVGIVIDPDGAVLNRELLAEGMAWLYTAYCKAPVCGEWKREEEAARQKKGGLWADASPTPPWEYRKAGRSGGRVKSAQSAPSSRNDDIIAGGYSGNTNSGIFHSSGCRYFNCKNCTARFSSRDEAISAGYRPCKVCRP